MRTGNNKSHKAVSDEVFAQIEQDLPAGPIRDLWWSVRNELSEQRLEDAISLLDDEFKGRHKRVTTDLEELSKQLEETN